MICNLGRKDLLAPHAHALLQLVKGEEETKAPHNEAVAIGAWDWGVMLVGAAFLERAGTGSHPGLSGKAQGNRTGTRRPGFGTGDQPLV